MSAVEVFLFLLLPIADLILWAAWQGSSEPVRRRWLIALVITALPQAAFIAFVLARIAIALLTGVQL